MPDVSIGELILRVSFLQQRFGAKTAYQILEPFSIDPQDVLGVNRAAGTISQFVGLGSETFIVGITGQKEGVAGNIELQHGAPGVFIEISDAALRFAEAIPAILAHEIAHKFLHANDVYAALACASQLEIEVLTDIAAVFLGLGKLMLNGCHCTRETEEKTPEGLRTTVDTYHCGYLDRTQLSLVYTLVCVMRGIAPAQYEAGLSSQAVAYVKNCRERYKGLLAYAERTDQELTGQTDSLVRTTQLKLAEVEEALAAIRERYIIATEALLTEVHNTLRTLLTDADARLNELDPCLKRVRSMSLALEVERVDKLSVEAGRHRQLSRAVARLACRGTPSSPQLVTDTARVIVCRIDGSKLRIPAGKTQVSVRCPRCQYSFIVKRSPILTRGVSAAGLASMWHRVAQFLRVRPQTWGRR